MSSNMCMFFPRSIIIMIFLCSIVSGTSEITTGLQDVTVTIDDQAKFSCVVKGKGESKVNQS